MRVTIVVDLQFGSTGKGLLAGYLAKHQRFDAVVTAWAPNAGHTFVDRSGRRFVHTQLANAVVSPTIRQVFIGPGSVIDLDALQRELNECRDLMAGKQLVIHAHAAVVLPRHREAELELSRIGSTQKGSMAAVVERAQRDASRHVTAGTAEDLPPAVASCVVSPQEFSLRLNTCHHLLVEGHQGFSLSIYHGLYPYVTSRDTTVHAILADCGVPRTRELTVWGTLRTFPIRVGGTSGPGYPDQRETTWDELGQTPEQTTVTKRIRRVFTYSREQIRHANQINRVDRAFVNFMNYLPADQRWRFVRDVCVDLGLLESELLLGYGATEADVRSPDEEELQ